MPLNSEVTHVHLCRALQGRPDRPGAPREDPRVLRQDLQDRRGRGRYCRALPRSHGPVGVPRHLRVSRSRGRVPRPWQDREARGVRDRDVPRRGRQGVLEGARLAPTFSQGGTTEAALVAASVCQRLSSPFSALSTKQVRWLASPANHDPPGQGLVLNQLDDRVGDLLWLEEIALEIPWKRAAVAL